MAIATAFFGLSACEPELMRQEVASALVLEGLLLRSASWRAEPTAFWRVVTLSPLGGGARPLLGSFAPRRLVFALRFRFTVDGLDAYRAGAFESKPRFLVSIAESGWSM